MEIDTTENNTQISKLQTKKDTLAEGNNYISNQEVLD